MQYSTRYITVETVREMCDWEYGLEEEGSIRDLDNSVVYCKTDHLLDFEKFLEAGKLKNIVLVSHGGAFPVSDGEEFIPWVGQYLKPLYFKHPAITRWYAKNCVVQSDEIEGFPCGLAEKFHDHGQYRYIDEVRRGRVITQRLFGCFDINTNPDRLVLAKYLNEYPGCTTLRLFSGAENRPYKYREYLEQLAKHEFAVVPSGAGPDTHRLWECLYLGVIPIVKWNKALDHFVGLPIVFVDNWKEVYPEALDDWLAIAESLPNEWPPLYIDFWRQQAKEHINERRSSG